MPVFEKKYTSFTFKKAAIKHLKTCEEIVNHLSAVRPEADKKMLLANLYYLSGYVLECVYKFGILSAMGKMRHSLKKADLEVHGLKSHDIRTLRQTYLELSRKKIPNISHAHFTNWDVQIRYWSPNEISNLEEDRIREYLDNCVKSEFNSINRDY